MKKMLAAATVLAFAAAPAMAEKMTIDFATAEGTATFVFDSTAGTYVGPDGTTGTYTFDEETSTLCGTSGGGELCATFEDVKQEVGHSSRSEERR